MIRVYLKKLNKPFKIHVNGDMDLYTRCLKALLEEDIDVDTLVGDNMKLFTQIYSPLSLVSGKSSVNGSAAQYYTNIIRI